MTPAIDSTKALEPMTACPPHHFLLDPPNGPESTGACKYCPATMTGKNVADRDLRPAAVESHDRDSGYRWRHWHMRDVDRVREQDGRLV